MRTRTYIVLAFAVAATTFGGLAFSSGASTRLEAAPASHAPVLTVKRQLTRATRHQQRAPQRVRVRDPRAVKAPPVVARKVFHADRVVPYFRTGLAAEARARLQRGDLTGAIKVLRKALAASPAHPERLRFVLAWAMMRKKIYAKATPLFLGLRVSYAALYHEATYFAARCAYFSHQTALAQALAQKVKGPGPFTARARLLEGDAFRSLRQWRSAARVYAAFLKKYAGHPGEAEARLRLAQCLVKRGGAPAKKIVRLLRQADGLAPHRVWGKRARQMLPGALRRVKNRRARRRLAKPTCAEVARRSLSLTAARRLRGADRELARARRAGRCPAKILCQATAALGRQQARKKRYRKAARKTLRLALRACQKTRLRSLQAKVKYSLAKVNATLKRYRRALALYGRVERQHPKHSYADDARYRSALVLIKQGKTRRGHARLRTLPKRYPKGDMAHAALWRLAWDAYANGQLKRALAVLTRSLDLKRAPPKVEHAGRDGYWYARVQARLGRPALAKQAWVATIKRHPLTFYALLSLSRLETAAPETARRLTKWLRARGTGSSWRFGPSAVYASGTFRRAVELARLGLGRLAARELRALAIRSPKRLPGETRRQVALRKKKLTRSEREQRLWAAAVLYDRAGMQHKSHWMVRHALRGYSKRPPHGANRARWSISFPRPYAGLVQPHAKKNGLPQHLVFGLMREESAFNPRLVSHANAVGLMQLLRSTAKRFRGKKRPTISKKTLKRPGLNVPIGTRYLGWLLRLFEGNLVPTVCAYNAGETKLFQWIRQRGSDPVDQFIEEIPFRETRNYVRRVLGSAFAYSMLAGGSSGVFELPSVFSAKLVVKAGKWGKTVKRWRRAQRRARRRAQRKRRPKARRRSKRRR